MLVFSDYLQNKLLLNYLSVYNKADVRNRLSALGMGKPKDVQSLTDEMAVELGAEVLGELTLMVILTGGIAFEYYRSASKSDQKQEEEEERMLVLERQIQDLTSSVKRQELHIREITESVSHNESYISKLWNIGSKK